MGRIHWQGVFPAVTTKLKPDHTLDIEAIRAGLERLIADHAHHHRWAHPASPLHSPCSRQRHASALLLAQVRAPDVLVP